MRNKIYLACPYSDPNPSVRLARFEKVNIAAGKLMNEGHLVFSPISHTHPIAVACDLPLGFDFWEEYDRTFIGWCDLMYVLTLENWLKSKGVIREMDIAKAMGKPISFLGKEYWINKWTQQKSY